LPVRNPGFSQSSELPLFTKGLRFYPNLRNNYQLSIVNYQLFCTFVAEIKKKG